MTTTTTGGKKLPWLPAVAVAVALAVAALWMRQSAADAAREEVARLAAQNESLQQQLAAARKQAAEPAAPVGTAGPEVGTSAGTPPETAAPATPPAAAPSKPAEELVLTPTGNAPPPRSEGLMLAGTHAVPMEGGIRATMSFSPTSTNPLGIVAVVVRLPRDGESRILQFGPSAAALFGDVVSRVSEDGKFAVFQGTAQKLDALELALAVSGAAVADVRGTCGIGPLKLDVKSTGATVQK